MPAEHRIGCVTINTAKQEQHHEREDQREKSADQFQEDIFQGRLLGAQVAELDSLFGQLCDHLTHQRDLVAASMDNDPFPLDLEPARPGKGFFKRCGQSPVHTEDDAFLRAQVADQGCGRIQSHDAAMVEDGYPVTQTLGLFHEMRGQQNGLALRADVAHQVPDGVTGLRVEAGGQFVQEDQLRVRQERQGNEETLFLPAGEFGKEGVALLFQPQLHEQFLPVGGFGVERTVQVERLPDLHPLRQVGLLQLHPGAGAQALAVALRVHAQNAHRTRVRFAQAFQAFDGGGFAGPVRADHPEDLAFRHLEGDIVHGDSRAVGFS